MAENNKGSNEDNFMNKVSQEIFPESEIESFKQQQMTAKDIENINIAEMFN